MGAVKKPVNAQSTTVKTKDYLSGAWNELKKVHWPNRQQLVTYTGVVFVSVAIVAVLLWIVDSGLSAAFSRIYG